MPLTRTTAHPVFRKTVETFRAGARTLPQRYFVSPEVFAEEQSKIFGQQWVCVGHQNQLARAGDYFVREVARESLIVVRPPSPDYGAASDQSSTVRAFYNVCRHRGTRLCEERSGHVAAIQCPYHAWTYALDGRLIGAPHMDAVPGFEKADYSLHAVKLGLWEGFIFVSLAEKTCAAGRGFRAAGGKVYPLEPAAAALGPADRV